MWLQRSVKASTVAAFLTLVPCWSQASPAQQATRDALLETAQTLRDEKAWQPALERFRLGKQQYPRDTAFQFGEIYVLADAVQTEQAVSLAQALLDQAPDDIDALLVMGYAQLRHAGAFAALQFIDRAHQLSADQRPYVVRDYIVALQRAQMAGPALEVAQRYPDLLGRDAMHALQADAVAESVRFADLPARSETERFQLADIALAKYATLFSQWDQEGNVSPAHIQRARVDRLQALHARSLMAELVQEYEALVAQGVQVPDYALGDVASAYLYMRKPEQSATIYQHLIASGYMRDDEVSRHNQDFGLLYAYADQCDVQTSQLVAQPLSADYPRWRYVEGDRERIPNPAFLDAQHTAS
ncbi:MAG: poly-beta-1,6 N-acetyl-D-glucosamine export porin PgaA, partial [Comamonas sp.]